MNRQIDFRPAAAADDAGIRRLLRESPMDGAIPLSLQREPSYFAACEVQGGEHRTVVGVDPGGEIVAVGAVAVRQRFFNGRERRIGYLGHLRLAPSHAGRFDILRRGYDFMGKVVASLEVDGCFTSITADNARARRFLERVLPRMPAYAPLGNLATCLIPMRPKPESRHAREKTVICDLLPESLPKHQLEPIWTSDELARLLAGGHFHPHVVGDRAGPHACAAVWDQRHVKQTVVVAYSLLLRLIRPLYNCFAAVPLPPAGEPVAQVFVSHLRTPADHPGLIVPLLQSLAGLTDTGVALLTLGLDALDPRLDLVVKHFPTRIYRTRLYMVSWPGHRPGVEAPDGRLLMPEVALL